MEKYNISKIDEAVLKRYLQTNNTELNKHHLPVQMAGTCTFYSILYSHILSTALKDTNPIQTIDQKIDKYLVEIRTDLYNRVYGTVIRLVRNLNNVSIAVEDDIHILKTLYNVYHDDDILKFILKYYSNEAKLMEDDVSINNNSQYSSQIIVPKYKTFPMIGTSLSTNLNKKYSYFDFMNWLDKNPDNVVINELSGNNGTITIEYIQNNSEKEDIFFYISRHLVPQRSISL